jgi:hypothetical protein
MRYPKKIVSRAAQLAAGAALALGLLGVPLTAAAADEAKLTVTATVLKRASLKVLAQPTAVVVTAADIARGYVDVAAPAHVAVQSNTPGYLLDFASVGDFMRQIVVRGLGADVQLSPAGGLVTQTAPGNVKTTLALGFRFVLSETAQPGAYPWPMRLAAQPL